MTVDGNPTLQRQCAVKPVIKTDKLTGAKASPILSCKSFLQYCDKIKEDENDNKNYLRYQFNDYCIKQLLHLQIF